MNPNASSNVESRAMSSVLITNIQNDVTEEQLKGLFSEIGAVVNFRVIVDKSSNKAKVAFCEYKEPEIAMSAVRNLNAFDFKGQLLNVDLATSEKGRQELQRLQASIEASTDFADSMADKAPEEISKAVASLPPEQMFELMKQMKMCIENSPQEARNLLLQNPQLAYALLQAQVIMRIVDPIVAVKILNRSTETTSANTEMKNDADAQMSSSAEGNPIVAASDTSRSSPVATDTLATNVPSAVPAATVPGSVPQVATSIAVKTSGQVMMTGVNPLTDQDMRALGDQDLRVLPNVSDRDMRIPQPMLVGDKDLRQPMSDQDFRTLGPIPGIAAENRPFDPRFRNMQAADRGLERARPANLDPRTPYDPRAAAASARAEDPRKASLSAALNSRLSAAGPALQNLGPNMASLGGPVGMIPDEQEKAALIMQVLQLTEQQISLLSPEQRQSIMVLKEQLARSQLT